MPNWKKVVVSGSSAALSNLSVDNALTASGLIYPTTDGQDHEVLVTDGSGNLSFDRPNVYATVKNVSGVSLSKGTPVHANGTTGNASNVIAASASVASTMPATYVLNEDLANGAEGVAIVTGFINGVNTSAFSEGDIIYVGENGGYTNVKPTTDSNLIQNLGIVNKVDATNGSGFIYGSGRSNDVPNLPEGKVWVGSSTYSVTSSVVHLDESNDRLGIGTTSPQDTLHVEGNITGSGNITIGEHNLISRQNDRLRILTNLEKSTGSQYNTNLYANRTGSYSSAVGTWNLLNQLGLDTTGSSALGTQTNFYNRLRAQGNSRYNDLIGFSNIVRVDGDNNVGDQIRAINNFTQILGSGTVTNGTVFNNLSHVEINNPNSTVGKIVNLHTANTLTAGSASHYYGLDFNQNVNANYHISGDYALIYSDETYVPTVGGSTYNIHLPAAMESYLGGDLNIGQAISASGAITGSDVQIDDWGSVSASLASINSSGYVDGTGAANKVAIWSDSDTLTSDTNLHWDSTNDRLGIGVSSPGAKLDIVDSGIGLRVKKADLSDVFRVYAQGSGIFMDNGNVHISDNLGIGTTSPQAKLHLVEDSTGDALLIETTEDGSDAGPVLSLKRNSSSPADGDYLGQIKFKGENDADQEIVYAKITGKTSDVTNATEDGLIETAVKKDGSNVIVSRQTSTDLKLINGTGLQVDGNVGIGTTSPTQPLHVVGNISGSDTYIDDWGSVSASLASINASGYVDGTGAANKIAFWTDADTLSNDTDLHWDSSNGRLGIGVTNPLRALQIGDGTTEEFVRSYYSDGSYAEMTGYGLWFSRSTSYLRPTQDDSKSLFLGHVNTAFQYIRLNTSEHTTFYSGSTETMRVHTGDGRVGIGTTSPSYTLDVNSGTVDTVSRFTSSDSISRIEISDDTDSLLVGTQSGKGFLGGASNLSTSNLVVDLTNGNVGIGTTTPGHKLDIAGGKIQINDGGATWFGSDSTGGFIRTFNGDTFRFLGSGNSEHLRVLTDGNVGIGTTTTSAKLSAAGTIRATDMSTVNEGVGTELRYSTDGAGWGGILAYDRDGSAYKELRIEGSSIKFRESDNDVMIIDNEEVGIGTMSPLAKLHIKRNNTNGIATTYASAIIEHVDAQLDILSDSDATWGSAINFVEASGSGENKDVWSIARKTTGGTGDSSLNFNFGTNNRHDNTTQFKIGSTGDIEINGNLDVQGTGTSTIAGNLTVEGTVTAEEFHTEFVSSSIIYQSGSTKFGDTSDDLHSFTGSIGIQSGSLQIENYNEGIEFNSAANRIRLTPAQNLQLYAASSIQFNPTGGSVQVLAGKQLQFNNAANDTSMKVHNGASSGLARLDFEDSSNNILMAISSSGNVGIGTTSPLQTLDVAGPAYFRGGTAADFGNGDTPTDSALIIDEGDYIHTRDGDYLRRLIGKSTSDVIEIGQNGTTLIDNIDIMPGSTGNVRILATTEYVRFDGTNKRVGIGTSSPEYRLHISGSEAEELRIEGDTSRLRLLNGSGQNLNLYTWANGVNIFNGGSGDSIYFGRDATNSNKFYFYDSASVSTMVVDTSTERVGIGTSSPNEILDIQGDNPIIKLTDNNSTTRYAALEFQSSGGNWFFSSGDSSTGAGVANSDLWITRNEDGTNNRFRFHRDSYAFSIYSGSNQNISLNANDNSYFNGGNVGIGTSNPSGLFVVDAADGVMVDTATALIRNRESTSGDNFGLYVQAGTNASDISFRVADKDNTEYFRVRGDGNVSIGTTNADHQFVVNSGTTNAVAKFESTDSTALIKVEDSTEAVVFGVAGDRMSLGHSLGFDSSNLNILSGSGYVGIGTTSPSKTLHISNTDPTIRLQDSDGSEQWGQIRQAGANFVFTTKNGTSNGHTVFQTYDGTTTVDTLALKTNNQAQLPQYGSGNYSGTAAYTLAVDSSGNIIEESLGAGAVDGAGQANYITRWQDSDTITSSSIYEDTSGNIGIGTTSPSQKLEVSGNTVLGGRVDIQQDIRLRGTDSLSNQGVVRFFVDSSDKLFIDTGNDGSNRFVIDSTGNVGIGTTTPTALLEVAGDIKVSGSSPSVVFDHPNATYEHELTLRSVSAAGQLEYRYGGGTKVYFKGHSIRFGDYGAGAGTDANSRDPRIYKSGAGTTPGSLVLNTNDTDRIFVSSSGKVGIGTTNPAYRLQIAGAPGTAPLLSLKNTATATSEDVVMSFNRDNSDTAGYAIGIDSQDNSFKIAEDGDSINSNPRLTIKSSTGRIGVGTTSPASRLHTVVDFSVSTTDYDDSSTGSRILLKPFSATGNTYSLIQAQDAGGTSNNVLALQPYGDKVGIGTTAPNSKLEIVDSITFANVDTFGQLAIKSTTGTTGDMLNFGVDDTNNVSFIQSVNRGTNTIPLSLQRYGGDVGIGTSTPDSVLHVYDSTSTETTDNGITIENAGTGDAIIQYLLPGVRRWVTGIDNSDNDSFKIASSAGLSTDAALTIKTDGKVGIGSTAPGYQLAVNAGTDNVVSHFYSTDDTAQIQINDDDTTTYFGSRNGLGYISPTGGTPQSGLAVSSSGDVLIGTDSRSTVGGTAKLTVDVGSNTGKPVSIVNGTTDGMYIRRYGTGGSYQLQTTVGGGNVGNLSLQTYGGKVGIGTTSPSQALTVEGAISSSGDIYIGNDGENNTLHFNTTTGNIVKINGNTGLNLYSDNVVNFIESDAGSTKLVASTNNGTFSINRGSEYDANVKLYVNGDSRIDGTLQIESGNISYQENTDVDSAAAETVASVTIADFDAAFFDYVIKSGTNLRAGTVTAVHDGTNVEYNEVSTQDLGDTTDVTLSIDISGADMRLRATTTSDNWEIKSLVRTI